ncbi:MAG: ABC transporter permease [Microbacteriaceae bacterium]
MPTEAIQIPTKTLPGWAVKSREALLGPVPISIVLALIVGALVIVISGGNPIVAYRVMVEGSLAGTGLVNTFERAVPLVGMALAIAVAFRAGVFNLGAEGQMILGALAGTLVTLFVPGPGLLVTLLAFAAAIVAGGLWGALSAWLENWLALPILITSLLLAYPARFFASYLVRFPLKEEGSSLVATAAVPEGTRLAKIIPADSGFGQFLQDSLGSASTFVKITSKLDWSAIIIVLLVVALWFYNRHTTRGYESGMTGINPQFAAYGGIATGRIKVEAMFTSGAIAGAVGLMIVLGNQGRLVDGALVATNYAWTGLLVALLAASRPIGVAFAGFFFAAIIVGGEAMARGAGVSAQISQVIQAVVIVFIAMRITLRWKKRKEAGIRPDSDGEGSRP